MKIWSCKTNQVPQVSHQNQASALIYAIVSYSKNSFITSIIQGTYTISNPPGVNAFFTRPRHQQQQIDPNGNSVFTNYGFHHEEVRQVLVILKRWNVVFDVFDVKKTCDSNFEWWRTKICFYGMELYQFLQNIITLICRICAIMVHFDLSYLPMPLLCVLKVFVLDGRIVWQLQSTYFKQQLTKLWISSKAYQSLLTQVAQ